MISLKYIVKAGKLYLDGAVLIQCKNRMISPGKIICDKEGRELLYTEIFQKDKNSTEKVNTWQKDNNAADADDLLQKDAGVGLADEVLEKAGCIAEYRDISGRRYLIRGMDGSVYASAAPFYAAEEKLSENGFPVCRMPRVDHAVLDIRGKAFVLIRRKWGEYVLQDEKDQVLMQIRYTGVIGQQYEIETFAAWEPEMIAGIVQLGRYMERESEFLNI